MELDVLIEDTRWVALDIEALAHAGVLATCDHLDIDDDAVEICVLACDDARIAALNSDFRDKSTATNVLSWPTEELASHTPGGSPKSPTPDAAGALVLGNIAIAYDTCLREAAEMGRPVESHVTHLIVHGTLHLLGYDHIRDPDATLMEAIETEILGKMGINDPYRI